MELLGATSNEFIRAAHFYISVHKPNVLTLLETKMFGDNANKTCKKLNFANWVRV